LNLHEGASVEVIAQGEAIVVRGLTLDEMLATVTARNLPDEPDDWGRVGREVL